MVKQNDAGSKFPTTLNFSFLVKSWHHIARAASLLHLPTHVQFCPHSIYTSYIIFFKLCNYLLEEMSVLFAKKWQSDRDIRLDIYTLSPLLILSHFGERFLPFFVQDFHQLSVNVNLLGEILKGYKCWKQSCT